MKTLIILLAFSSTLAGQDFKNGISLSILFGDDFKYLVSYNANLSYPIPIKDDKAAMPILDLKISIYNNYLGASVIKEIRNSLYTNIAFSPSISYSFTEASNRLSGYVPIFTDSFRGVSNSKYYNNLGFSVTYSLQMGIGKNKFYQRYQRIGGIFISTSCIYLNYYNDGGPINKWFGDRKDRYWTGGISLGIRYLQNDQLQSVCLSFDKYNGFYENAFEVSDLLYTDNVMYNDLIETTYNSGKYTLRYTNVDNNFGAAINYWNSKYDIQDILHRDFTNNPYHYKLKKPFVDMELSMIYEN